MSHPIRPDKYIKMVRMLAVYVRCSCEDIALSNASVTRQCITSLFTRFCTCTPLSSYMGGACYNMHLFKIMIYKQIALAVLQDNFYTLTVYEKGAEIVRLYNTLLGKEGFRRAPMYQASSL